MTHDAGDSFTPRFTPRLTRWLAFGWGLAVATVFFFHFHAWLYPVWLAENLPAWTVGEHFGDFWLRRFGDGLWCLAVLVTAFAGGAVVLDRLVRERTLLTGLFALAVGLWLMATGVLVIGCFATGKVGWIFLLAAAWLLPAPRAYFRNWSRPEGAGWLWPVILLAVLLCLFGAVTPPFEYDELEYHLGAPSEYLKAGRIIFLPHNFYSNLPQLTEMLYLLGLVTRSDIATKMLHWCFGWLSALAVYAVAGKLWSRRVGLLAAALFYCVPFIQDLSQTARIDLATTFYATLAFGGVLLAFDGNRWIWLAGLAAGGAVATKWTAIPVVLLPCGLWLLVLRRSVWGIFLAGIAPLPWLLKNWSLTGNPIYPLLSRSELWTTEQAGVFAAKHYASFDTTGLAQFVERIWQYSFIENGAVPTLLLAAPLALLIRDNGRVRRAAGLFVLAYLGWYLLTFRPWRFLFPVLPVVALLGACALDSVGKWCRGIVAAVWLTGLAWMGAVLPWNLLLGQVSEREFLVELGRGVFAPIVWMNENLPATARVLYIGEARVHHARHPVVWASAFDRFPANATNGVTHIYVNPSELKRISRNYGYPRGLDLGMVERHCGREIHRGVFEWQP
ncbi:MAG: hypothetical protein PCFJNLEI_03213 [Verrucomicrobiae bacterium]|nr:hypothetical protein [Verrucomicrobiae bacterium]